MEVAQKNGMEITHPLVTHFHPDHLGGRMMGMSVRGAPELLAAGVKAKIHIHKPEAPYVNRVTDLAESDVVKVEGGDDDPRRQHPDHASCTRPDTRPARSASSSPTRSSRATRSSSARAAASTCRAVTRARSTTA